MGRFRSALGTVRLRTTLGAVLVVAIVFAVAGGALMVSLRESLINDRREVAEARADEIVGQIESVDDPRAISVADVDDQWVQVIDSTGAVIESSPNAAGRPPVVVLQPDSAAQVKTDIGDDSLYVAAAASAESAVGPLVVVVGRGLDDVADSTDILGQLLLITLPVLLAAMAVVTYVVVGRALSPVDRIRREVDDISPRDLDRRIAVPGHVDEISRLARTMNRMLERLQGAQDRQHRFVSDAAHELRSPIASIRQHAEVALAHPGGAKPAELAATVLEEERRLERLVEDLILLARLDEGSTPVAQEVDLDDLVFEEARRLKATTELAVDTGGVSGGRVRGDPLQLRRMVANLVDNAGRHAKSRVTIGLNESETGSVVLRVEDDGPGIPPVDRERVFGRFVRLDQARTRDHGGSGLGLAIVADVVAAHNGSVTARESPTGGAQLEVVLPGSA